MPQDKIDFYPYYHNSNSLYMHKETKYGKAESKLCNFVPCIESEKTVDDGATTETRLVLKGIHSDGSILPSVEISASELSSFNWLIEKWGAKCIIDVGQSKKDNVRCFIQMTSQLADHVTEYRVTGWKKIGEEWQYLMPQGFPSRGSCHRKVTDEVEALPLHPDNCSTGEVSTSSTASGPPSPQGEGLNVVLKGKLQHYSGEQTYDVEDILAVQDLYHKPPAPSHVMHPLIAFTFLTPLNEFLRQAGCMPKFVLFLTGRTGTRKSTLAALFLSFFGQFTSSDLPMSFRDTANSIIANAFTLKDVLTCIDDFYPSDNAEMKKLNATAQTVMRAYGDRTGRARLRSDSTLMESRPPQGNAIITGELSPDVGESGTARYFALELKEDDVDLTYLGLNQKDASDGAYRRTMYAYTEWMKRKFLSDKELTDKFIEWLRLLYKDYRSDYLHHNLTCHGRLPETVACLMIGMRFFLQFMEENGVIKKEDREIDLEEFRKLLYSLADIQSKNVERDKPALIFVSKLCALIEGGKVLLTERSRPESFDPFPPGYIGCQDEDYYYLNTNLAHSAVKKLCAEQGESFPVSVKALVKALVEEDLIKTTASSNTVTIRYCGAGRRFLALDKSKVEQLIDTE